MDTIDKKKNKAAQKTKERRVPSPEGVTLVSERKKKSAGGRMVPRSSAISPKVTELENAKGKSKTAMKMNKGG
ncbi:hypothetical protein MTR67_039987 [Solanum verrucosum]|uniref:Uncharacterized protein n=1 Tax=Solanum verrucosum TaxID=315347 RepID=A0AAF0UIE8_SOLVR|nr:hypothetical protein MTR67_039987 [Solanum verrucosum]